MNIYILNNYEGKEKSNSEVKDSSFEEEKQSLLYTFEDFFIPALSYRPANELEGIKETVILLVWIFEIFIKGENNSLYVDKKEILLN